ncbi:1-acyl-sn-glycerol-3-phosphate acyltransferase [Caldalkalibacillus thermarum TA2.A1]|uniref:1-acyl-sn-glycerol-3-phosphate acyltransferase n=1 Tax=Caldalkalibacillus thermarum (strain TA2.A1) TaxID=986075 RepID=A0A8X8I7Y2_CALTT|nr:lysophospholipid acyltransferase family protein [Caldalkalibacillus thermarum]QZT32624.1 1-acyl-sn-glycerol-3-phosphate acyltransferase [Caldalkalibacillus thermarum TA2.A1]
MFYEICRIILHTVYRLLFRYKAYGTEHIPEQGAVLLCANHISNWDPPLVGLPLMRRVNFMAKQELFKIPLLSQVLRYLGAFPVKRGATDKKAIRTALSRLQEGKVVVIFPEGTRSKSGRLQKAYSGFGFLALKQPCTVIPVAIIGPYRLFRPVKIIYGSPVNLDDLRVEKITKQEAVLATERIMNSIRQLLENQQSNTSEHNGRSFGNSV